MKNLFSSFSALGRGTSRTTEGGRVAGEDATTICDNQTHTHHAKTAQRNGPFEKTHASPTAAARLGPRGPWCSDHLHVVGRHNAEGAVLLACAPPVALAVDDGDNLVLFQRDFVRVGRVRLVAEERARADNRRCGRLRGRRVSSLGVAAGRCVRRAGRGALAGLEGLRVRALAAGVASALTSGARAPVAVKAGRERTDPRVLSTAVSGIAGSGASQRAEPVRQGGASQTGRGRSDRARPVRQGGVLGCWRRAQTVCEKGKNVQRRAPAG